nr:hypothetical protein [uncultured Oscillibacter sp.]
MRRLELFALVLAFLLTLSACGGTEEPDAMRDPPPQDGGEDVTLYDCGGLEVALPNEYLDQLRVDTDFPDAQESWKPLISVYEKASYEAAMEDFGGGGGFLFGFLEMDQAAFEQHIRSEASGLEVFATDGEHYYAYTHPTDVQFYRPGLGRSALMDHPDWKIWEELCEIGPAVQEDFLSRNSLSAYNGSQLFEQPFTYVGEHVYLKYYSAPIYDGEEQTFDILVLSQPASQGQGGIWAVERWLTEYGYVSLYFPDTGIPAAEYYSNLQSTCDAGERPELLTPVGAAQAFVKDYFGQDASPEDFEECDEAATTYIEANLRFRELVTDLMAGRDVDDMELLKYVGLVSEENLGILGRSAYASEWWPALRDALEAAAIGDGQQTRDRNMLAFFLTMQNNRMDHKEDLASILQTQAQADPGAFTAALAEFSEEDQTYILESTGMESTSVGIPAR